MPPLSTNSKSATVWSDASLQDRLLRAPLAAPARADVVIVGAGIAGVSIAYSLAREGRSVIVLDDGPIGGGETGFSSAHLSCALDDRYSHIEHLHGSDGASLAAQSHAFAIERFEQIAAEEAIACEFKRVDGYLLAPMHRKDYDRLLEEELAAARRARVCSIERVSESPLAPKAGPCLRFPNQAECNPLRFVAGLALAAERRGARIFTGTHVRQFAGGRNAHVETAQGVRVDAGAIVVATNTPVNDRVAIHTKQTSHRTYIVGFNVNPGRFPPALLWDGLWPGQDFYHYVRLVHRPEADILLVGGEDHRTGEAGELQEHHERLITWASATFGDLGPATARWSGQVVEPYDNLAFIGRNPFDHSNVYIVTGDSGMGMTHGMIAATLIPDLILGRANPWAALYEPSRISLRAGGRFMLDAAEMAAQYRDWITSGPGHSADEIPVGGGAVIQRGLKKIAVCRDDSGELIERSAVCPHLGGVVRWNPAERTWDCPCHGSRFDRFGNVLNGPACKNLASVEPAPAPESPAVGEHPT